MVNLARVIVLLVCVQICVPSGNAKNQYHLQPFPGWCFYCLIRNASFQQTKLKTHESLDGTLKMLDEMHNCQVKINGQRDAGVGGDISHPDCNQRCSGWLATLETSSNSNSKQNHHNIPKEKKSSHLCITVSTHTKRRAFASWQCSGTPPPPNSVFFPLTISNSALSVAATILCLLLHLVFSWCSKDNPVKIAWSIDAVVMSNWFHMAFPSIDP